MLINTETNRKSRKKYFAYQLLKTNKVENLQQEEYKEEDDIDDDEDEKEERKAPEPRQRLASRRWKPSQSLINQLQSS
jgi:hypothetical protein